MNWMNGYMVGVGWIVLMHRYLAPIPDGDAVLVVAGIFLAVGITQPIIRWYGKL